MRYRYRLHPSLINRKHTGWPVKHGRVSWYLVKSYLSCVRYCTRVHWKSHFLQGTRKHCHVWPVTLYITSASNIQGVSKENGFRVYLSLSFPPIVQLNPNRYVLIHNRYNTINLFILIFTIFICLCYLVFFFFYLHIWSRFSFCSINFLLIF